MNSQEEKPSWEFGWRIFVIYAGFAVFTLIVIVLTFSTDFLGTSEEGQIPSITWFLLAGVFIVAILTTLSNLVKILNAILENRTKLEIISENLKKNQEAVAEATRNIRLSEAVKAIIFHEADSQCLREAVLEKLEEGDFGTAGEIIELIASRTEYKELAEQLRAEADKRRGTTEAERMEGAIAYINMLFESYDWIKANGEIERLIKTYPDAEEAKAMRKTLIAKKEEHKRVLLNAWDDAVKRRATDRSLEILKELDLYLTPQEALALQESAKSVFKDKLHNLGVQFSLAVSGEQWNKAIEIGHEIMQDFPNSRISGEIRERMDLLKQKVELQHG
jgi:hypothetical protein